MKRRVEWYDVLESLKKYGALPHRILLWGPPGTGKSSWPYYAFGDVERLALHEESAPEDFLGQWLLTKGETQFFEGAAVRAMKRGVPLVLDEVDRASASVESLLHAVLDDLSVAALTLPTGEVVRPRDGYMVVGTSNAHPSSLPEPILDRFDIVLCASKPHPGILRGLGEDLANLLINHYNGLKIEPFCPPVSVRRVLAFAKMRKMLGGGSDTYELAAFVTFGDNWKEVLASVHAAGVDERGEAR